MFFNQNIHTELFFFSSFIVNEKELLKIIPFTFSHTPPPFPVELFSFLPCVWNCESIAVLQIYFMYNIIYTHNNPKEISKFIFFHLISIPWLNKQNLKLCKNHQILSLNMLKLDHKKVLLNFNFFLY